MSDGRRLRSIRAKAYAGRRHRGSDTTGVTARDTGLLTFASSVLERSAAAGISEILVIMGGTTGAATSPALVAAMRRALGALSREIAVALRAA